MACIVYSLCEDFPALLQKHKERLPDHLLLMTLFFFPLMQKLNVCASWTPLSVFTQRRYYISPSFSPVHSCQSVLTFLGAVFTVTNLFSDSCYFWPRCTQKTFGAGKPASPRSDKTAFIRAATADCFIKMLLGRTQANWKLKVHLKYCFIKAAFWSFRYFTLDRFNFKGHIWTFFFLFWLFKDSLEKFLAV